MRLDRYHQIGRTGSVLLCSGDFGERSSSSPPKSIISGRHLFDMQVPLREWNFDVVLLEDVPDS